MGFYKDDSTQDLDKLLTMSKGTRTRLEPTWQLNLSFYRGAQWVFYNRGRLDRPQLDPHRVTLTDNRIVGIVRTELAKMTKAKPAWQVIPTTPQDEDLQAALMGEKVLDYLWRHLSMRNRLVDSLLWSRICGGGFWKIVWDSAKGQKVQIAADQDGQPVMHAETGAPMKPEHFEGEMPEGLQSKTIATGDVCVESVSPFEIYPDPIPYELEDCEWLIQETVKSPEYVKLHFDQEVTPDAEVSSGMMEARATPMATEGGGSSSYKGVKLREYWCKPNSTHPQGKRAVWAKGKMLYEGPNPYEVLPYIMFKGIPVPGRFWPTSVVENLRGPQTELNKIRSQIVENAQRIGNPALLKSKQANVEYSGVPGEEVLYDDTTQNAKPEYLQPPQMPQYVLQQQDRIEQSMQEISGQHEVSNAQVPAGVKAASAINLLQEADDTRLGPAIYDMEEALARGGEMLLKLVAKNWTDERTILIAGKDHALDSMVFKGAMLKENTQVEVQAGSAFPKSKAAKQAAIQEQLGLYFQYMGQQPINKRMLGKVLEDMEAGALAKLFGDISKDESQINSENQQIAQGAQIPINTYDNHQAHVEGHTEFQKGPTYLGLGLFVGHAMEQHVAEHRQRIVAEMGPPQPQATPSESLNYKDAPPDIRRQIESQAGLAPSHDESAQSVRHPQQPEPQGAPNGSGGK
jgi:hypothetical protein